MAIPMDNTSELSRQRVQRLYNKNVELETRRHRSAQSRVPTDPNVWQQMRENYEAIILEDHAFAEQYEVEFELWQLHYQRIDELRAHFSAAVASTGFSTAQSAKVGPARPDRVTKIRSQFKTFLSEATGFYHELMLKIRAKYGLPLGYISDDPENQIALSKDENLSTELKKGLISCQRCLIYLGDLARYKGLYCEGESKVQDFAAASSYYTQASSLWPSSGNPHHQLAILASYSGDEFLVIYRYFRSLAVESPFLTARENLIIAFEKNRQNYSQLVGASKTSSAKPVAGRMNGKGRGRGEARIPQKENKTEASCIKKGASSITDMLKAFGVKFVRLNGILFTRTSLETFVDVLSMASSSFLELLSAGLEEEYNLGSDAAECALFIVRLVAILIFTVHNVNRESENQSYAETLQRSVLLQHAYVAVFEFMGHILERCIQLHDPLSSFLLPGLLVFVEWLACHPDVAAGKEAEEKQANVRFFFWNNCILLFNKLLLSGFISGDEDESCFFNMTRYEEGETSDQLALWEDFELRGFLPLQPAHQILDFSRTSFGNDGGHKEKKALVQRIIGAGKAFANVVQVGQQALYFDPELKKFAIGPEPQMYCDFALSGNLEMPLTNDIVQDLHKKNEDPQVMQPTAQLFIDGEDEEEEIVFKPPGSDKHSGESAPFSTSYEVPGPVGNVSQGNLGSTDAILMLNAFSSSSRHQPSSLPGISTQPVQLSTSNRSVEQQASILNGFNKLSMTESMDFTNLKPRERVGTLQHAALPLPFPGPVNIGAGSAYSAWVPETGILPKSNSIMSSGIGFENASMNFSSRSRKNPVSRPVRHIGPPPGFTSVPPKNAGL
ncbi:hypothetical protein Nepgr_020137 [Nepenthes gracilis]|uniref:Protein SMG7-like n=1 Tax=Nepenthes gracilis TaxID=150966 RepID=A0AAD3SWT0_NEPGR|nr:hypothetical protein Nepgr_020137 [Nepenthes gracilis]